MPAMPSNTAEVVADIVSPLDVIIEACGDVLTDPGVATVQLYTK